ncbi:hypothetical protein DFH28DRAFT_1141641 [Melampsora americana]|nr:hypothetical protein DFH28DRAFT_1141641 [Melampsora americana]
MYGHQQNNRAAHVNQQRAQLQQARRPSPYNRSTRASTGDSAKEAPTRLNASNRHNYPNVGAILAARQPQDVRDAAAREQEKDQGDTYDDHVPETPTPTSKAHPVSGNHLFGQLSNPFILRYRPAFNQQMPAAQQDAAANRDSREAEATQDSQTEYVSAAEKDNPASGGYLSATEGRADEEPTTIAQKNEADVLQSLSFKKVDKVKEDEAVRQVQLHQARTQYVEVKELYNKTKEGVEALEAKAASGAIDKALHLSRMYLTELEATMKEDEDRLLEALSSAHPDVIFVPTSVDNEQLFNRSSNQGRGSSHTLETTKRKATNPGGEGRNKRQKDVDPAIYLDLEAKESNKPERDDDSAPRASGRRRIKSRAIVTQSDDEWASGPVEINLRDVVQGGKAERRGAKDKEGGEESTKDGEVLPEDATSIFHVEKPDLSEVMKDATPEEVDEIRQMREEIKSSQFNWGDILTVSVCNVIRQWCYQPDSTLDKPTPDALTPHLMYIRALVEDRDMMTLRLQTSPRLMQVSSVDPFVNSACLNWDLIQKSTLYPWSKKNGIFRALHVMTIRNNREPEWTSHSIVKGHIAAGYSILHNILADALKIVSFKNDHASINIRQDGEDGIAGPMVEQAKTMTWLARQCFVGEEDAAPKRGRIANATVRSLQKKFFHVLLGVNIVFESEVHNGILIRAEQGGETVRKLKSMKASQKSESVLFQLFNDRNKHESLRVKSLAGGKSSKAIASTSGTPSQSAATNDKDKTVSAKNSRDVHDFKKECLQYLALFLMYGTSAFFHVWPAYKDQTMVESALLINLASLLSDRRYERCGYEAHVFGARAWNRLDELMFRSLKMFVTDAGTFKNDIRWSEMTRHFYNEFDVKKLAGLYMLDLLTETHRPGLSLGIDGRVMEHIRVKDDQVVKLNDPLSETFRALWGPTEGPLIPVSDRGASLYPEVDGHGTMTRPHNPLTKMAADQEKANRKDTESATAGDSGSEDEENESAEEDEEEE